MEIRYFQVVVLIFIAVILYRQYFTSRSTSTSLFEKVILTIFVVAGGVFTLLPDLVSNNIAKMLGMKSNINATVFVGFGLLFYFQFQLYKMVKRQDNQITELTRIIALKNSKSHREEK